MPGQPDPAAANATLTTATPVTPAMSSAPGNGANLIPAAETFDSPFAAVNGATSEPSTTVPALRHDATVMSHCVHGPGPGTAFHHFIESGLTSGAPYCASFWVWVPAGFGGKVVAASINGFPALGGRPADLALRDRWQRVWCSATIVEGYSCADPSLVIDGDAGDVVYTTCWQFEPGMLPTGFVPTATAAPEFMTDTIHALPLDTLIGTANPGGPDRVDTLALAGLYRRRAPRAIDTAGLDPAHVRWVNDIFNAGEQSYDEVRCAVLKDALIAGQGSVVTRDGWLVRDSAAEFLAQGRTPDGFAAADDDGLRLPAPCRRIATPVLLLKRPWWRNFGHWLIDSAATLAFATRLRRPASWHLVVGRQETPQMRQVVADTIACLAPGVPVLEHPDNEVWACDELLYVSPLHVPPLFKHPEGLAILRARLLTSELAGVQPARRLFVSRGAHPARQLDNEAELIALAQAHGYEVVEPQHLDLAGQARLFHGAASVVGVKGAALTNLLFCPAGASCLVLSPGDFPDPFFWDLASHAGVAYAELFGRLTGNDRPQSHNSFAIDPARFADMLPR